MPSTGRPRLRPLHALGALTLFWTLACARGPADLSGEWVGLCDYFDGEFEYDVEIADGGGFCKDCDGEVAVLQGLGTVVGVGFDDDIDVTWYHCRDKEGCTNLEGDKMATDDVLWVAQATNGSFDTWFEGSIDPDDSQVWNGDCTLLGSVLLEGPGSFVHQ